MAKRLSWSCPFRCKASRDERESLLDHFADKHVRAMEKLVTLGKARKARSKRKATKRAAQKK